MEDRGWKIAQGRRPSLVTLYPPSSILYRLSSILYPLLPPTPESLPMPPTGLLSFPGVDQVLSWSFTLSHGITPSAALVEIAPQFGLPAEIGTMLISFGDLALE